MPVNEMESFYAGLPAAAEAFAARAHAAKNQVRKYTGVPYIEHPRAVEELVRSVPHTPVMRAAAFLHDVVEDTDETIDEIRARFGNEVADMVGWLSDVSKPEDGNRARRKQIDREHTAAAPADVKTVKLADLIDNSRTITAHDPNFAKVYMVEKRLLLEVLREGDPTLYQMATAIVEDYFAAEARRMNQQHPGDTADRSFPKWELNRTPDGKMVAPAK